MTRHRFAKKFVLCLTLAVLLMSGCSAVREHRVVYRPIPEAK